MPTLDRQIAAGDQFSFSSTSAGGEVGDDYGLAFGEWTGWHPDNYHISGHYNEPQWLVKASTQSTQSSDGHLCPASQEQAIARYKKEMLEMVKDAPEYAYELSLRDLAELPRMVRTARESPARDRMQKNRPRSGGEVTKSGRHSRSGRSMETGGFLLKMFLPMPSPGTKRSSKSSSNRLKPSSRSSSGGSSSGADSSCSEPPKSSSCAKVPPKPSPTDGGKARVDKGSDEQQHAILSRNCSRHHVGCYPFFLDQKEKQEQADLMLRRFLVQNIQ